MKIFRHFQSENSDSAITNQSVTRPGDAKNRGEMTGWRVENSFREKQRTRGLRAGVDDIVIETFRVDDAAIGDRENQCGARRSFCVADLCPAFRKSSQTRDNSET